MRQITGKYERATALLLQLTIMCVVFAHGQDDVLFTILQPAPLRSAKLFAGASLPLGEFGDNDPTANNGGFAYPGFAAGFEYMHELTQVRHNSIEKVDCAFESTKVIKSFHYKSCFISSRTGTWRSSFCKRIAR